MARARNIKPGFFDNELLVELSFEYRLLFIGLWTIADKEGRLEDRSKKIKMQVFPADNVDVDGGLSALCDAGFIVRYGSGTDKFIQINNWKKHQSPHHTERDSVIPPLNNGEVTNDTQNSLRGNPPDSLIPDSLIPDSLQEQSTPDQLENKKPTATATATRLPADWAPSDDDIEFCEAERKDLTPSVVADRFRDYWIAQPGAKGRKLDWPATWRNWVRNEKLVGGAVSGAKSQYQINHEATARAIFGARKPANEPRVITGEVVS